jgi:hypothetical protein
MMDSHPPVPFELTLPVDLARSFLGAVESARQRLEKEARAASENISSCRDGAVDESSASPGKDAGPENGDSPGSSLACDHGPVSWAAARMFSSRGLRVPAWVGLLALLEEFVETWDVSQQPRPPSKDAVHTRDGWRCMAPGCSSRKNLHDHHLLYRSRLGSDDLSNRVSLCEFHHQRGEHGELASCRGVAPLGIEWSLGRGGRGGLFRNERRLTTGGP